MSEGTTPSIAAHPRAREQIRRAKGWGGLAGFGLVALYSHSAGVPLADVALRAIVGGSIGWLVAWIVALQVWRQLTIAEVRKREREWLRERAGAAGELEQTAIVKPGAESGAPAEGQAAT